MTRLQQARKLFAGNARRVLRIVSLSALAVSAYGGTIFQHEYSNADLSPDYEITHFGLSASQTAPDMNGNQTLAIEGSLDFACMSQSCGPLIVTFGGSSFFDYVATGYAAWHFTGTNSAESPYSWAMLGSSGQAGLGEVVTGTGQFAVSNSSGYYWEISLTIQPDNALSIGQTFTLTLTPNETLDISATDFAAPEPASAVLTLGAGAMLVLCRKRRT